MKVASVARLAADCPRLADALLTAGTPQGPAARGLPWELVYDGDHIRPSRILVGD